MGQRMQEIADAGELLALIPSAQDGWIYIAGEVGDLLHANFLYLTGYEDMEMDQVEVDGEELPVEAHRRNMSPLLDVATLQSILKLRRKSLPNATVTELLEAIRHYVVNDDFMD